MGSQARSQTYWKEGACEKYADQWTYDTQPNVFLIEYFSAQILESY